MARRYFVTLESVARGDQVMSMAVGQRLELPRNGKIECGRVPGLDIVCRGQGQGGRRCFGLVVDGERVVIQDYRHGQGIWVRGKRRDGNADLAPGDVFGPCDGIRFVLGAQEDAPVLYDMQRVGRWWCANPRGDGLPVWSAVDLNDPLRAVVDVVLVESATTRHAWDIGTSGLFADALHPSLPRCIERLRIGAADVRVGERTAGISLERIVECTQELGASIDGSMAAWLAESVGWCILTAAIVMPSLERGVVVRFDDGQPIFEPASVRIGGGGDDEVPTWRVAGMLRNLGFTPPNDRIARALTAADDAKAGRAGLVALLEALAEARDESGGDMRTAWHGLVQRLFPEDAAADRDVVDALRLLGEADALALLEGARTR